MDIKFCVIWSLESVTSICYTFNGLLNLAPRRDRIDYPIQVHGGVLSFPPNDLKQCVTSENRNTANARDRRPSQSSPIRGLTSLPLERVRYNRKIMPRVDRDRALPSEFLRHHLHNVPNLLDVGLPPVRLGACA